MALNFEVFVEHLTHQGILQEQIGDHERIKSIFFEIDEADIRGAQ